MPRPRRLNIDTILGFNCSYSLKMAITRTAEIAGQDSPSSLMRQVMENHCRLVLGADQWQQLAVAEVADARRVLLAQFLNGRPARRLRNALAKKASRDEVLAELSLYARDYSEARDDRKVELGVRVALLEVVDVLMKIGALLKKAGSTKLAVALNLTRRLAEPLRDDVDTAVRALLTTERAAK